MFEKIKCVALNIADSFTAQEFELLTFQQFFCVMALHHRHKQFSIAKNFKRLCRRVSAAQTYGSMCLYKNGSKCFWL